MCPRVFRRMAIESGQKKKRLIIVVGPTAIGKTSLSIRLAQHYNCPILSFDSRQFYKEMSIGTAKPTSEELSAAKHYFVGNRTTETRYTAGMFEKDALDQINSIFEEQDNCIAVGGSGLYINALAFGIDNIPASESIRADLEKRWKNEGLEVLQEEVKAIDPEYFQSADMQNPRRVMRALEAYKITGKKLSDLRKKAPKKRPFGMKWVGLNLPRPLLFERINKRVDIMLDNGLEAEAKSLYPFKDRKALKTVGYRELFDYFDGVHSKERAIELIKRNTRIYAKRQITWFEKNQAVQWYQPTEFTKIIEELDK